MKLVSVIIPCFNEAENIFALVSELRNLPDKYTYEIIFIDDGSTDNTLMEIMKAAECNPDVRYVSFSRNFGHQNALKAGFDHASGDCVVMMDADLQHTSATINELLKKWEDGYEIVLAKDKVRQSNSFFKKVTSKLFYKIFSALSGINEAFMGSDFRLIDRSVVAVLVNDIKEYHLFYRGIINWLGFKQCVVDYASAKRLNGRTKYSLKKMFSLALNGTTSFTVKPLRLIIITGFVISFFAFCYGIYALYVFLFTDKAITGWTSVILSILLIGGLQLFFLGIIGEYLGKMFFEVKKRPHYLIRTKNF